MNNFKKMQMITLPASQMLEFNVLAKCVKSYTDIHPLGQRFRKGQYHIVLGKYADLDCWQPHFLYIISQEEIMKNDWVYVGDDILTMTQADTDYLVENLNSINAKKIIATTNPALNLPLLKNETINWFIENANKYVSFKDVMVNVLNHMPFDGKVACEISLDETMNTETSVFVKKYIKSDEEIAEEFIKKCNVWGLVSACEGGQVRLSSLLTDFITYHKQEAHE